MSYIQRNTSKPLRICDTCYDQVSVKDAWDLVSRHTVFECASCGDAVFPTTTVGAVMDVIHGRLAGDKYWMDLRPGDIIARDTALPVASVNRLNGEALEQLSADDISRLFATTLSEYFKEVYGDESEEKS